MISDLCERDQCETCFEDELDACAHGCHDPLDSLAGLSRPTTEQPSTGGARQAQDPAASAIPPVRPRRGARAVSSGTGTPPPAIPSRDPRRAEALSSPQHRRERAAAGRPDPGTGEADPASGNRMPASPGRGTDTSPAGGALEGARGVPAGSTGRTYTITLPAGLELLNANDRDGHWARRKRVTRALRETAGWKARIQHIPALQRAYILGIYEPPDRRRRDPANLYPSFKACVDGLVDAGVLPDDDATHVDGPDMRLGDVCPLGRLVLRLTEVAATGGEAA